MTDSSKVLTIERRVQALRRRLPRTPVAMKAADDPFEYAKLRGSVMALLERAMESVRGELRKPRFDWSWAGLQSPEAICDQAESFIDAWMRGERPFAGKYCEPGWHTIDHAIFHHDGLFHCYYIRGRAATNWPEYPTCDFGHAVSTDLKRWTPQRPVLHTPAQGWDEYQVWAPHVIAHNGRFFMFYTGVNRHCAQAIGLAVSTDLYHWRRVGRAPVIRPGAWGVWSADRWSDCRDPMVLQADGMFYCYYTAQRQAAPNAPVECCVGVARSNDLLHWDDAGYIRLTHSLTTPPESVFVTRRDGAYHMIYTNYQYGLTAAVSEHPVDGWRELPVESMSVKKGVSASEIIEHDGQWYLSFISHQANMLRFLEVERLIWRPDRTAFTRPL